MLLPIGLQYLIEKNFKFTVGLKGQDDCDPLAMSVIYKR